jgi:GDP-4-dehydro-6-deoxy-D-mannose reductase
MRALVTGAAGFVGGHLVAHLQDQGDDVVAVDRSDGPDLLDRPALEAFVAQVAPEVIYHLAGWSDVGGSWLDPVATFETNANGTLNLLLACRDAPIRVLSISSADVYGRVALSELPIAEDAPLRPVTPYAVSKVAADFLGVQAHLGFGVDVIRVRAFNHLGPGQTNRFVAPALAERIALNEFDGTEVVPVGNLSPRRDFTDVRDVVRAYRLLTTHGEAGEAYNVCSGTDLAISELADLLVGLARHPMRLEEDPARQRPVEIPVLRGDPTKLHKATGWQPEIPISQTLADLLAEWRARVGP